MATIIHAKDLRPGHTFLYKNNLYLVIENSFNKTAMREGIVKCKVKNLRTQSITVEVLTGEKLEQAPVIRTKAIYSYLNNDVFVFFHGETYDQIEVPASKLQWEKNFFVEGLEVSVLFYESEILSIQLPDQIGIEIEYAESAVQGNTVQTAMKKAKLITGFELEVPQFIKTGEKIFVRSSDGTYIGRDNK